MIGDIAPDARAPNPERIAAVTVCGVEFVVSWDGTDAEDDTYCDGYVAVHGSKAEAWVESIKLGGKWWDTRMICSVEFRAALTAALLTLEDFRSIAA